MTSFLAGSLANAIAAGFRGKLLTGTLRKVTTSGRDGYGDPVQTTVDYTIQGLHETYSALIIASGGVPSTDVKLLLIAGLCGAAPAIGDKIQINSQWFQVRNVNIDPASATYECQSFRVP